MRSALIFCAFSWIVGVAAGGARAETLPAPVAFEQHLGAQLPTDVALRDETGAATTLGSLFGGHAGVIVFGYSRCPQLCSVVSNAVVETLRALEPTAGRDFSVVYVSIDPTDTPRDLAALKRRDVRRYGRTDVEGGWHYVTGSEAAIAEIANAAGFRFTYDQRSRLYSHASGFVIATPDARVSQYFFGVDFSAKDVAAAIERAGAGKTGHSVYQLLLLCARGAMITGKYGRIIWVSLEIAVLATVLALAGGIGRMLWNERKGKPWEGLHAPTAPKIAMHSGHKAPPTVDCLLVAFAFRDWLPDRASTVAPRTDAVFWTLVGFTLLLVTGLVAANLYFLIRYRRGSDAPRPPLRINHYYVEAAWIVATTVGFIGFFFWGANLYLAEERPPPNAMRIDVTARQWMWDIRHGNGRREFNELHVPLGQDVQLVMMSEDVIHSFFVPAFRLKQDVVPGKQVSLWFKATKTGTFHLFCAEYCGTVHSGMVGDIVVMPPAAYAEWLTRGNAMEDLAQRGRRLFTRYNCSGCHDQPAAIHAPELTHLYGSIVPLSDGRQVRADDYYIRDSILQPQKDIVAGYQPLMPTFQNVIPESDVLDLIAYIRALGASSDADRDANPVRTIERQDAGAESPNAKTPGAKQSPDSKL